MAVVEFAVVAPILFMLVIGIVEVGRAVMVRGMLTNASREGARVAGNDATTSTSIVQATVNSYLAGCGITGATTTVSPDPPSQAADGEAVTVTVSISYANVSWVPSPWFFAGQTLAATSVMTRQPSP